MKKCIAIIFVGLLGFASCKKETTESTETTVAPTETTELSPEATPDTTAVAPPPIDNPEPGVESSGSKEQVP